MSIIQTIRDRAWIIAAAIAIALIAFIVQDAFQGGGGMGWFGGNQTTLGKVNGTEIDVQDFERRYKQITDNYTAQGFQVDDQTANQIREQLWNQYVEDALLSKDYKALGFTITDAERSDILYGKNPPPQLRNFIDSATGQYDPIRAYQEVSRLQKNSAMYNQFWYQLVPELEKVRMREKYIALIGKSAYVPKWLVEKTNTENSQRSSIAYVMVPYATIPDSTVTITDDEIKKYVDAHPKWYPQEKARGISYVSFDAGPSAADSAEIYQQLDTLKEAFRTTDNIGDFLRSNGSQTYSYYNSYIHRKEIKIPNIDSIIKTPVGGVFGPYIDDNSYAMARIVDVKTLPDTVRVRHILISTHQRTQTGQLVPVRPDTEAKKIMDSIENAIKKGSSFDSVARQMSEDGSRTEGGVIDKIPTGQMTEAFNDFIFTNGVGARGVVKTEFGYHLIEVLSQKGASPAYKIAYFSKPIVPSDQTINSVNGLASQFVAESRDYKKFEENAKKQNLNVFNAADIKPLDNMIMGIGSSRELVRWIFNADRGEVAEAPFMVGDKFIIPVVTQVFEKGTMDVSIARPMVEYRLKNEKKAEQIVKKIGNVTTLEAASQAAGQPILKVDSLMFNSGFIPNIGQEQKLLGAAFSTNGQGKVLGPIKGESGVFVIRIDNLDAVANPNFDAVMQREGMERQLENNASRIVEVLKKSATIKDNRARFF